MGARVIVPQLRHTRSLILVEVEESTEPLLSCVPLQDSKRSDSMKLMFSRKEVSETLGVSVRFVDILIGRKELVARRIGRRVLVPCRSLQQFVGRDHVRPTGER